MRDLYKVCIEDRDEDGDVTNSDVIFPTYDRNEAVQKAIEVRDSHPFTVIETWDEENGSLLDTTLECQY
ncbi:hypothetical protein bpr_II130 (plasmid) [Butyrivibrio proteoclasticus B316]|uniref:Uncharacterized protein n=1 Tax=Butyrivibrio proteoclasticus (strain ATCC 51982 / DSM 14932 / B316) TaxID=515622 RepID=E0S3T7_BUTPB|nr:hypothetical protein [Butyrivibrio proteoclasticus]ADL36069.1 hypothetical protein bpr_II130 [Butyrivibrio proteoclasticus B316]